MYMQDSEREEEAAYSIPKVGDLLSKQTRLRPELAHYRPSTGLVAQYCTKGIRIEIIGMADGPMEEPLRAIGVEHGGDGVELLHTKPANHSLINLHKWRGSSHHPHFYLLFDLCRRKILIGRLPKALNTMITFFSEIDSDM
jgi:hypothetical protein